MRVDRDRARDAHVMQISRTSFLHFFEQLQAGRHMLPEDVLRLTLMTTSLCQYVRSASGNIRLRRQNIFREEG